jgi:integrase
MTIVKRGKAYQVRVAGTRARTVPTRDAAKKLELDLKLRKSLGELYEESPNTLGAELEQHIARKTAAGNPSARTVEGWEYSARQWDSLRHSRLPQLRRAMVEDKVTQIALLHPKTAKDALQLLKAVLREAGSRGQRIDDAVLDIPAVRHKAKRGRALEPEELLDLSSFMPEYIKRFALLAGRVGFRVNELFTLTDDRVDLRNGLVFIPEHINKSRKDKHIPLTAAETDILREQLLVRCPGTDLVFPKRQGGMWNRHHYRDKVWLPACEAAGLVGFTPHHLRHTAISLSLAAGMPVEMVADRVGHSDGGALILRRYRHLLEREWGPALGRLDAYFEPNKAREEAG